MEEIKKGREGKHLETKYEFDPMTGGYKASYEWVDDENELVDEYDEEYEEYEEYEDLEELYRKKYPINEDNCPW